MRTILLGAPGAGKGTQAAFLANDLGLVHIASGDLFRAARNSENALGRQVTQYMDKGELVPDSLTIEMVLERIAKPDCQGGYILDGFPRTLEQAWALDAALTKNEQAVDSVLLIDVPADSLIARLSGRWICRNCQTPYHETNSPPKVTGECDRCNGELYQREDDTEETVRRRLEVYVRQTTPLIQHYQERGILFEVNGEQLIESVTTDLKTALQSD